MGKARLTKSLIQFSVNGQGCVSSLLLALKPNYDGGNEDNGDLLQKVPCSYPTIALISHTSKVMLKILHYTFLACALSYCCQFKVFNTQLSSLAISFINQGLISAVSPDENEHYITWHNDIKSTRHRGPEIKDEDPGPAVHLRALGLANHDLVPPGKRERHFDRFRIQLP